jgi:nitrogen fixation/metabolism regulation signal transduction histidine kinase
MVGQIIAFSREREQERKPVDVWDVIKESLPLLRISMPKSVQIVEKTGVGSDVTVADAAQLHQVMMNLGGNVAHAMRERGASWKSDSTTS